MSACIAIEQKPIPESSMKLLREMSSELNITIETLADLQRESSKGLYDKIKDDHRFNLLPEDLIIELRISQDLEQSHLLHQNVQSDDQTLFCTCDQ